MSNMRALFFAKMPPPNTGSTLATETVAELLRDEIRVDCIDTSTGDFRPATYSMEWVLQRSKFAGKLIAAYGSLWRRLRRFDYDIFYFIPSPSLFGHWRSRIALEIARPHVQRVVAHIHSGNFMDVFEQSVTAQSARRMVDAVDTFLFLSRGLSDQAASYIPSSKRSVVRNTIDEQVRFSDKEIEEKISGGSRGQRLRVLFLSNMLKTKGYRDVAEAVEQFNTDMEEEAIVDFVGEWKSAQARRRFEEQVGEYRYSEMIRVHGRITDRRRIRQILLDADIFVLPTHYPTEAQPISIIEALNAGTPVIATSHASIPEYVFDGENGYLVDKKSPLEIKNALQELSRYSNWLEKARAARNTYENMFSQEVVRDEILREIKGDM